MRRVFLCVFLTTTLAIFLPAQDASDLYGKGLAADSQNDHKEAAKWYRLAAEQGHAGAQFMLAGMYDHGRGVPQDHKEAAKWLRLAAEQGDADAQFNLGVMYFNGEGIAQDFKAAVKWYLLAVQQGHAGAWIGAGVLVWCIWAAWRRRVAAKPSSI